MADTEKFICGSRVQQQGPGPAGYFPDLWIEMPDKTRTCSYCGSLHEQDFIRICEAYADGKEGYDFDPTTKSYKRYARNPGVQNASQGGIKFYGWHSDTKPGEDLNRRIAIHQRAVMRFQNEMNKNLMRLPSNDVPGAGAE